MPRTPTRILLDIDPGPPIHGEVRFDPALQPDLTAEPGAGDVRTFSGWIGLLSELQAALADQPDT